MEPLLQVLYHGVLGVDLWAPYLSLMVTTGREHASWQSIAGTSNSLTNEVKLSGGNHVLDIRDVVEFVPDLGVLNSPFLYAHHVDGKNGSNPPTQENFEFVEHALSE